MKLKCDAHNRRVVSGKTSFLHRTGDLTVCAGAPLAVMIDNTSHIIRHFGLDGKGGLTQISTDHVRRPIKRDKFETIDLTRYTRPQE